MAKIADIKSREGGRHWRAKTLLFDFITDRRCKFVTDTGIIDINRYGWQYATMEAFVTADSACAPSKGLCGDCFSKDIDVATHEDYEIKHSELMSERFKNSRVEANKNTVIIEQDSEAYVDDPCNFCKFNDQLDVRFIFDIALWRKGAYTAVVEIENTSPVKRDKIEFCRSNNIDLIIVKWEDVITSELDPAHFKARIIRGWEGIPI